jgi:2-aminoadipate transaminase
MAQGMAETITQTSEPPMDLLAAVGQAARSVSVEYFNYDPADTRISFAGGLPDPESLPTNDVAQATVKALAEHGKIALQYGRVGGYKPLVDFLRDKLKRTQMMDIPEDGILLTAGSMQALTFVVSLLVDRGDTIISEDPVWPGGVGLFNTIGAKVVTVPLDGQGMRVDVLEERLAALKARGVRPKFIYTLPTFQNPAGVTAPVERRLRIIDLAAEYDTFVFEDDAYNDLRFDGEPLPAIYALDRERGGNRVISIGTFSKILGAGMRIGWVVAPPAIVSKIAGLKGDGGVSPFATTTTAEFCLAGRLEPHIELLKGVYQRKRDAMVGALEEHMPESVTWTVPDGGFFLWLTVPEGVNTAKLMAVAACEGVEYLPGVACRFDGAGLNEIRLSFSVMTEEQIREGISRLGRLIHRAMSGKIQD